MSAHTHVYHYPLEKNQVCEQSRYMYKGYIILHKHKEQQKSNCSYSNN